MSTSAAWALAADAPVVPILACPEPGAAYRVIVREPIAPEGADPDRLSQLCHDAVAREVYRRPELAVW